MKKLYITIAIAAALLFSFSACEKPTAPADENLAPETFIANVPVENDTLFPLVTLSWNGGDEDGFVAKYEHRYITYFLTQNDSLVQDWVETDQTSATLTLISSDELNKQRFQVRAIDNDGLADPTPAEKIFFTKETITPQTEIISPLEGQEFYVLDATTDWWRGIPITFTGEDLDGEILEFAWAVDGGDWTWTTDTTLFITPDMFNQPLEGSHTIRITARDNTNLLDPSEPSVTVTFVRPTFTKTLLILDETDEDNWPSGISASDDSVDQFYADAFGLSNPDEWDEWDIKENGGVPSREILGQYKLLLWHGDHRPTTKPHELAASVDLFKDYASVGGDFILSGWRMVKSLAWQDPFPKTFAADHFANKYLHIASADETPLGSDFTHGVGVGSFTDVQVDTSKLNDVFPFFGSLAQVNIIPDRGAFTDIIYTYGTSGNTRYPQYRGKACALIYYGTSFNAVVLGFPVFFIERDDANVLGRQILESMNY